MTDHEINTPLTATMCQAENVKASELFEAAFSFATDKTQTRDDRIQAYAWRDAASHRQDFLIEERNRQHGLEFSAAMILAARNARA